MNFKNTVETNSVPSRLRKSYTTAKLSSHTVLTDDVFSYVDFFFKTHKKTTRDKNGKIVPQNYLLYWEQAKNFYRATKSLPVESSPLPMYYCMLNAIKAYLFYYAKNYQEIEDNFRSHGLKDGKADCEKSNYVLDNILIKRKQKGVFVLFANKLESDFDSIWKSGKEISVKGLMYQLPFIHAAYINTYSIIRKNEKFIPLETGTSPEFKYGKNRKIYLTANIDKKYFKQTAICIPADIVNSIPESLTVNTDNPFQLLSQKTLKKKDIINNYSKYRKLFTYIESDRKLWYLKKEKLQDEEIGNLNSMIIEIAIAHRFSEIVRYKPEQMIKILQGKENWLVHEFLSLVLDQFMDELACEITRQDIMTTRNK